MKVKIDVEANKNGPSKIDGYKLSLQLSNDVSVAKSLTESEMKSLLEDITQALGYAPIIEKFGCTVEEAKEIKEKIGKDRDCKDCELKMEECYRCCNVCQSPLERDLLKALVKNGIQVELQLRLNKDGEISHFPEPVVPEKILTIPDFYIETESKKICVYTDGHTYHERTEYQAVRDRSIDRELQNLGYEVLRFTTSEVKDDIQKVVASIKKTMGILEQDGFDDAEKRPDEQTEIDEGTCIRCGKKIPYDCSRPFCLSCWKNWTIFDKAKEKYCHKCGKEMDFIDYKHPICRKCL
ncbi:DUF559 domain-containing protein [uncultured Treponema sp.]|uniref:endonuclease domain-containing protein n=1 Tax=uncultured Treponema sp. TaxID=162155 RepID=UPI0025F4114B|nr:DUF559 domain-containing protein [uncultured Treponema sp.]